MRNVVWIVLLFALVAVPRPLRDLADEPSGPLGIIYPGTCRDGTDAVARSRRYDRQEVCHWRDGHRWPREMVAGTGTGQTIRCGDRLSV